MLKTLIPFFTILIIGCNKQELEMNPFFEEYETPFKIPPFEKIKFEHYEPAFMQGIDEHQKEIVKIAQNEKEPTFENTLEALESSGKTLDKVANVFYNLLGSNTNDEFDALAVKMSPLLSAHNDKILLNKELFERIKILKNNEPSLKLSDEQKRLLDETYKRFQRAGANLDQEAMIRLTEINSSLSSLSVQFDQNVLKETNGYSLIIDDPDDLQGLPNEEIRQASLLASSEGHDGKWVFKPTRVSMYPFLTYSEKRELRENLYKSYILRGDNDNDFDNKEINLNRIEFLIRLETESLTCFERHQKSRYQMNHLTIIDANWLVNAVSLDGRRGCGIAG